MLKLTEITVAGFRVFIEPQTAPLDADVVLVHGPNGCGKTSLLHGIELCLTGRVADLDVFPNSYPGCLRHLEAKGEAWVSISYVDEDGRSKDGKVTLPNLRPPQPPGGVLSRSDLRHFQERCYLSQSRLAKLLEIYQAIDKERKESPLATFVRELLGLESLENLTTGLEVVGDKRRIRRDIKAYAFLESELRDLAAKEEELQSKLHTAIKDAAEVSRTQQTESMATEADLEFAQINRERLSEYLIELQTDLSAIEQAEAVLKSIQVMEPAIPLSDLENEIRERQRIQNDLAKGLREHLAEVAAFMGRSSNAPNFDDLLQLGEEWNSLLMLCERKIAQLQAEIDGCAQWNQALNAARVRAEELDRDWSALIEQLQSEQTPSRSFTETLSLLLEHIDGNTCPVCDRDFDEVQHGSLLNYLRGKLKEHARRESLVSKSIDLQRSRDEQRRLVAESEAKEAEYKLRQQQAEQAIGIGRLLILRHRDLGKIRDAWIANDQKQRSAKSDVVRFSKASEQRARENSRLEKIAERVGTIQSVDKFDSLSRANMLRQVVSKRLELLQAEHGRRLANKKANEAIATLREEIKACKEKKAKMDRAFVSIERVIDNAKAVARIAAEEKRRVVESVFSGTLNNLWRDLFERLVISETFHPCLPAPEVTRGRMETRLSAGRDGKVSFDDLASVLSSGNLNTAALSLFLTLNIVEKPKHHVLILDDPVQNMDDIHVVHLGALLKAIAHQARRQLIVAIHDRALFDYLRIELGPTRPDQSLITIQMKKNTTTQSTSLISERHVWQPDKIVFGAASA